MNVEISVKAVRLRRTELFELTGFRLEFIPMKIGAGMTEKGIFRLFYEAIKNRFQQNQ
ncbi:MAG: hypothetical protein QME78_17540 [Thermodesulfobacteriota bacterium]|nr:hypothetical protein [Thermodesulfobacteriota bacterium]